MSLSEKLRALAESSEQRNFFLTAQVCCELGREAEALERDAKRYRWLRRWWVECYPTDEQGDPIDGGKIALSSTADCLDELIDAALAKEQP